MISHEAPGLSMSTTPTDDATTPQDVVDFVQTDDELKRDSEPTGDVELSDTAARDTARDGDDEPLRRPFTDDFDKLWSDRYREARGRLPYDAIGLPDYDYLFSRNLIVNFYAWTYTYGIVLVGGPCFAVTALSISLPRRAYEWERWLPIVWCAFNTFNLVLLLVNTKSNQIQYRLRLWQMKEFKEMTMDAKIPDSTDEVGEVIHVGISAADKMQNELWSVEEKSGAWLQAKLIAAAGEIDLTDQDIVDKDNKLVEDICSKGDELSKARDSTTAFFALVLAMTPGIAVARFRRLYPQGALIVLGVVAGYCAFVILRSTIKWRPLPGSHDMPFRFLSCWWRLSSATDLGFTWDLGPLFLSDSDFSPSIFASVALDLVYFGIFIESKGAIWAGCGCALFLLLSDMRKIHVPAAKDNSENLREHSRNELLCGKPMETSICSSSLSIFAAFQSEERDSKVTSVYLVVCFLIGVMKSLKQLVFFVTTVSVASLVLAGLMMGCVARRIDNVKCAGGFRMNFFVATNFICYFGFLAVLMLGSRIVKKEAGWRTDDLLMLHSVLFSNGPCKTLLSLDHVHCWHLGRHIIHQVINGVQIHHFP